MNVILPHVFLNTYFIDSLASYDEIKKQVQTNNQFPVNAAIQNTNTLATP